jgi:hypothetical protein
VEVKDEFELLRQEVEKAAVTLKGKKYAFDSAGKPITISNTKAEQLPPFAYEPVMSVHDEIDKQSSRNNNNNTSNLQPQKKQRKIRVAGSRTVEKNFIPTTSLATTLSKHKDIMLNPGVSLVSDEGVREGPAPADDPRKPSRKQFFNKKLFSSTANAALSMDYSTSPNSMPANSSLGGGSTYEVPSGKDQLHGGAFTTSVSSGKYLDIDPTSGGKPRILQSDSDNIGPHESARGNTEPRGKQDPALGPRKRSEKAKKIMDKFTGGSDKAGPRERLPEPVVASRIERRQVTNTVKLATESSVDSLESYNNYTSRSPDGDASSFGFSLKTETSKNKNTVKKERMDIVKELF